MSKTEYIKSGFPAQSHTPVYKMHKYFARRPQNVFRELAQHYSEPGDIVLDVFCGGGVTLFEGLSIGRKIVACDVNPLAAFISRMEVTKVNKEEYLNIIAEIRRDLISFSERFYTTHDRDTGAALPVRWYEHAYQVECPFCNQVTTLSNGHKAKVSGWYRCENCHKEIQGVNCNRTGEALINVTYKVTTKKTQRTVLPDEYDIESWKDSRMNFESYVKEFDLWIPDILIPAKWDRQQEDCLYRKGVTCFADFFTKRSLIVMSYFLKKVKALKNQVSDDMYDMLLLTFSATLRYTNNLTISTDSWQDGRPVAWAKHAYWLSNQFVEVNPVEYLDKRVAGIKAAVEYQEKRLPHIYPADDFQNLKHGRGQYLLLNQDSRRLPIEGNSVDLVLTDPPYGGNVQYGELSAFWLAWLYEELGLDKSAVTDLTNEILVNRKQTDVSKDHEFYYKGLRSVFSECYRVLKPDKPLVFTFNNKNPKVWMAVMKAALDSGFTLEPEGVIYQEPIEHYINTAHTKYSGALLGDFIYTFIKSSDKKGASGGEAPEEQSIKEIERLIDRVIVKTTYDGLKTTNEIYIEVFKNLIPKLASLALEQKSFKLAAKLFKSDGIENRIKTLCIWDKETLKWRKK